MGQVFHRSHKKPNHHFTDAVIYVIAFLGPIMTIPQVLKIWVGGQAQEISLITWLTYTFLSVFWMFYCIAHKEKPLVVAYILYFLVNLAIVLGVVILG